MKDLFWRLNTLPESQQSHVFAGVFGYIQAEAHRDSELAKELLNVIEERVASWEERNTQKEE